LDFAESGITVERGENEEDRTDAARYFNREDGRFAINLGIDTIATRLRAMLNIAGTHARTSNARGSRVKDIPACLGHGESGRSSRHPVVHESIGRATSTTDTMMYGGALKIASTR